MKSALVVAKTLRLYYTIFNGDFHIVIRFTMADMGKLIDEAKKHARHLVKGRCASIPQQYLRRYAVAV